MARDSVRLIFKMLARKWKWSRPQNNYHDQHSQRKVSIQQAPSIWQRAMEQTLRGIPNVEVMLDDDIVTGKYDVAPRDACGEEGGSMEITQLDPKSCTMAIGIEKMKETVYSYVWWPRIDEC